MWLEMSGEFDSFLPPPKESSTISISKVTAHSPKKLSVNFDFEFIENDKALIGIDFPARIAGTEKSGGTVPGLHDKASPG